MNKEETFTKYPNAIQEALHTTNLTALESRVLHFIIRRTFGHHKSTYSISQRTIEKNTGIDRRTIRKILQRLKKRKILLNKPFVKGGRSGAAQLGVNPNVNSWLRVGVIQPHRGEGSGRPQVGAFQPPVNGRHSTAHIKEKRNIRKKEKAKDGDGNFSTYSEGQEVPSPLTEKQVLNNAKYLQKKRNRLGLVKVVEKAFKLGASPEQVQRRLSNEKTHGGDLVQVIKEITVSE